MKSSAVRPAACIVPDRGLSRAVIGRLNDRLP